MARRSPPITNKVLLAHMQAGHEALRTELTREIRRLDAKIETLRRDLTGDITGLRKDVTGIKAGVAELKGDVSVLKDDVGGLKGGLVSLKGGIAGLKEDMAELKRNDEKTHTALQRLYERRVEMVEQLADHEKRLVRLERPTAHAA